ncbi:Bromodomain-containing protein [Gloeopeniophorella convolvens]|nr:Bromodomain-containing protein [Gloeopeniophorella convolvens]
MSKRELEKLANVVDVDAPRAKRRREAAPQEERKADPDMDVDVTGDADVKQEQVDPAKLQQVKEQGLKLWQTIKDAVDKECVTASNRVACAPCLPLSLIHHDLLSGRSLSTDFLRLPNKRMYPDYYTVIKKPIALDKIKSELDTGKYHALTAVKSDLEQCFRNAKRYNIKDSQIFNDAKLLHKLTSKEYVNMTGDTKGATEGHEEDGGHEEAQDSPDDEVKRKKAMTKLLTTRLDKLIAKKDDAGNTLSTDFMELPNKKIWAIYYKAIARPMSFEKIYKHLKRKEYSNVAQFAHDVELVFSNAMQFNEDHTPLWEAALQLKESFAKLMSDLPPPYAIPQYAPKDPPRPTNGKIKLKMPPAQPPSTQASTSTTSTSPPRPQSPLVLKVPAPPPAAQAQTAVASSSPVAGPSTVPTPSPVATPSQAPAAAPTPAPVRKSASATAQPPSSQQTLQSIALTIAPTQRRVALDSRDGVRSWSLRLAPSERTLRVSDVRLFPSGDSDDEDGESEEEEEEEEEGKEEGVGPVKRPPRLHVRLDKADVEARVRGRWEVALGAGPGARVLELRDARIGDAEDAKGVWRVYLHSST